MIQSIFNFDNINFNGGNISCDGGSILLLSFLKKYNLLSSLDDIPFNDTRRLPKYSNSDIVTQIVLRNGTMSRKSTSFFFIIHLFF